MDKPGTAIDKSAKSIKQIHKEQELNSLVWTNEMIQKLGVFSTSEGSSNKDDGKEDASTVKAHSISKKLQKKKDIIKMQK